MFDLRPVFASRNDGAPAFYSARLGLLRPANVFRVPGTKLWRIELYGRWALWLKAPQPASLDDCRTWLRQNLR
jgi:hypothetical protein